MRHVLLLVVVAVAALWPSMPLRASGPERMPNLDRPGDTTLIDETFRLAPGADVRQCLTVAEMTQLTVIVSSPIGRTGETSLLNFSDDRQTVSPNVQLSTVEIPTEDILSTHLAPAGSYCYYIAVTHTLTSTLPADALEMPDKQIHLKIISTPYVP